MTTLISADRLLRGIKRRANVPLNQNLLQDSDVLELADDSIVEDLVPILKSAREDFFVTKEFISTVADQAEYPIPSRALGSTLRDLKYLDADFSVERDLSLIALEDIQTFILQDRPYGFYFEADQFVLVKAPLSSNDQIQVWYELRPSTLIQLSQASKVVSVSGDDVTVESVADGLEAGVEIDFVKGSPNHFPRGINAAITSVAGNTISFGSGVVPTQGTAPSVVAGDYIAFAGTSPVVQLPYDCYTLLEIKAAQRVLFILGDLESRERLDDDARRAQKNLLNVIEPRVTGENTKLINRNSLLRGNRNRIRRSYYG